MNTPSIWRQIPVVVVSMALFASAAGRGARHEQPAARAASNTSEAHLGKGYDALRYDRYQVAADEFRAALKLDPNLVLKARFPLAVALFELHKFAEARRELELVRRQVGNHPNVLYYLGRLDIADRNFAGAIRNLSQAATKPPFPDTAYYLGFSYFQQGHLAAAAEWLNKAAKLNPRDARVPYQLSLVYRKQGLENEMEKALALSQELRQRDQNEGELKLECAKKLDDGLRDEAHAICEKLYDPDNAEKLTMLGTIYGEHGDLEAALKPLLRAAELAPQSPQMQYNLALAYFRLNQFEKARAPLAGAIARWPDLFQLNALYGAVLLRLGEELPSYQVLRRAHQLNPQDSSTGDLLYVATLAVAGKSQAAQQHSDSLRYLDEAAAIRPSEPEPHRRMAEIYTLIGNVARAMAEQKEAERLSQNLGKLQ